MDAATTTERLTLSDVADQVRLPYSTVAGWCTRGVGGVRLRSYRLGGRRFVSPDALREFLRQTNAAVPATV